MSFVSQTSFGVTERDYQRKVYATPIPSRLGRTVRPKNSISKIQNILQSVKGDIKNAASRFGINPIHIAGAIAGEHALNVDTFDSIQDLNLQRRLYLSSWVNRTSDLGLAQVISGQNYSDCRSKRADYEFWYCVTRKWNIAKAGGLVNFLSSESQVYKKFTNEFFNPNGIGSTFGVGQMSPLRALMVSDLVARRTHLPSLNFRRDGNSTSAFDSVLDPSKVIYYIAATIKVSIDMYKAEAHYDISMNPGVTATLYNIGNERFHAQLRFKKNMDRLKKGERLEAPRSNNLGRWVLQNLDMIQQAIR